VEGGEELGRSGRRCCGQPCEDKRQREVGGEIDVRASAVGDWEREGGVVGLVGQVGPNQAAVVSGAAVRQKGKKERAELG
jgi:hypothetical protein